MDSIATTLSATKDRVVAAAHAELLRRREPHYSSGEGLAKLEQLLAQILASVEDHDSEIVARYAEGIAGERLRGGFEITELQSAFNALEEALWLEMIGVLAPEEQVPAIEAVASAFRAGRDALARTWVALARLETPDGVTSPAGEADEAHLTTEVRGNIAILTMHDEAKRNALGAGMAGAIVAALERFARSDVRVVVLRASPGMMVWSAGHDINELPRGRRDPLAYNDPLEQCVRALRSTRAPVIAMIHGSVWGGAFDLVLSCDVVIADETATFAITPANLGLPYNTTGLLHFIGRLPVNVVKEMFFTAKPIDAHLAERWLVVNHLVPAVELEGFTFDIAATMAAKAPLAIAAVKEQLRVLSDFQPIAAQVNERIQALRREAYDSSDYLEGLTAFAEKRPPVFRGV